MKNNIKIKNVILPCGCDVVLPLALVYSLYIVLHGHLSPGGGFQGGVLMAAAVLLLYFGHGHDVTAEALSFHLLHHAEGAASTVYVALAMLGVAVGAQFCQNVLYTYGNAGDLISSGTIFWMNLTVGIKVITGIGSISLLMIGVFSGKDVSME